MDLSKVYITLECVTRLNDGLEQLEDLWGDELSDGHTDDDDSEEERPIQMQTEDGQWLEYNSEDEDEWVEEDEEMLDVENMPALEPVWSAGNGGTVPGAWPTSDELNEDVSMTPEPPTAQSSAMTTEVPTPEPAPDIEVEEAREEPAKQSDVPWKRFEILPSAPADHAFYGNAPPQTSRQFLSRLNKEYKALESSLPGKCIS